MAKSVPGFESNWNLWRFLKIQIRKRAPANINYPKTICQEEWYKIPTNYCKKLIENNRKRLVAVLYTHLPYHNDSIIVKTDAHRKTHEERKQEERRMKTSLATYLPLTLLQGFERVVQGLHVRGCWRPNINFIFWPHCYDRHVVSFLFSWFCGPLHRGFRGPLGRVWPSLPHLVSSCLEFCWQLLWHPKLNWVK